ncbi:MAG: hypothetical protein ACM3YE_01060 [Bacteroidota bacterium]
MIGKKLNPNWDSLLTPEQRMILTKPGFGILQELPYLPEEDVKEVVSIIEECIKHLELIIKEEQFKNEGPTVILDDLICTPL